MQASFEAAEIYARMLQNQEADVEMRRAENESLRELDRELGGLPLRLARLGNVQGP